MPQQTKKIKVTGIWVVNSLTIPGAALGGAMEIVPGTQKHKGIEMELTKYGVVIRAPRTDGKGQVFAVVPLANIKAIVLAEDIDG